MNTNAAKFTAATSSIRGSRIALSLMFEPNDIEVARLVHRHGSVDLLNMLLMGRADEGVQDKFDTRRAYGYPDWPSFEGIDIVIPSDPNWIPGLYDLTAPPLVLYVRGQLDALADWRSAPTLSVVGARACTSYGEAVTHDIVAGVVGGTKDKARIVSGGAYGIDGAAHRAALAAEGKTIAFLAGGVDRMYPMGHQQLSYAITDQGALVSEMPPGTAPTKWRFLARNRLISAASQATLVVEAGIRSGSLNTAGHAHALSRRLGAVPGPVTSAASAGCHHLMREYDAAVITTAAETLTLMGIGDQS